MSDAGLLLIGLAILAGIVGILVPVLPGSLLVLGAILVWALVVSSATGWAVLAGATVLIGVAQIVKYLVPGRRMRDAGVPNRTIAAGAVVGIVGFFVIPIVGLFLGFPAGVYLAERHRLGPHHHAWESTKHALKALGLSILIELTAALLVAGVWLTVVLA
ncbi:MAG TPA: DUF456 domain-containing protein [Solirubrobacteraceae bacterium]|nr:DUF456 domain-containing protein [Solirubrobacteraceae bacterium]